MTRPRLPSGDLATTLSANDRISMTPSDLPATPTTSYDLQTPVSWFRCSSKNCEWQSSLNQMVQIVENAVSNWETGGLCPRQILLTLRQDLVARWALRVDTSIFFQPTGLGISIPGKRRQETRRKQDARTRRQQNRDTKLFSNNKIASRSKKSLAKPHRSKRRTTRDRIFPMKSFYSLGKCYLQPNSANCGDKSCLLTPLVTEDTVDEIVLADSTRLRTSKSVHRENSRAKHESMVQDYREPRVQTRKNSCQHPALCTGLINHCYSTYCIIEPQGTIETRWFKVPLN